MVNSQVITENIERLISFGLQHSLIQDDDEYVARNTLLSIMHLQEPCGDETRQAIFEERCPNTPTKILDALLDEAAKAELFDNEVLALRINFETKLMGALMPRQSELARKFKDTYEKEGPRAATNMFYDLCIKSNYIRTAQIEKNIKWDYTGKYGALEITINMTKPEKDPKTIALERLQPSFGYPKCMLCIENIGYEGRVNFPARQTHRAVPIDMCNEQWYLQYSPYVYYNEHCIVFSKKHEPMTVSPRAFEQIFDFVDTFNHYTCGSNADLPIVGGSILSHTHFQGGNYVFPMHRASVLQQYAHIDYPFISIENINWPMGTLRIKSADKAQILKFACHVLDTFRDYTDEAADIIAYTDGENGRTPHNTITPILHFDEADGEYIFDLVPRNNRTSDEHPDGIFHPHAEIHHIKKENIGLIEVMGLAILPSRLKEQSAVICSVLSGKASAQKAKEDMPEHADWIDYLVEKYGTVLSPNGAEQAVKQEIGAKFETCLEHAGVFKPTQDGQKAYERFMLSLGCCRRG